MKSVLSIVALVGILAVAGVFVAAYAGREAEPATTAAGTTALAETSCCTSKPVVRDAEKAEGCPKAADKACCGAEKAEGCPKMADKACCGAEKAEGCPKMASKGACGTGEMACNKAMSKACGDCCSTPEACKACCGTNCAACCK